MDIQWFSSTSRPMTRAEHDLLFRLLFPQPWWRRAWWWLRRAVARAT